MLALAFGGLACSVISCFLVFYVADFFDPASRSGEWLALYGLIAAYPTVLVTVFINVALAYAASAAFDGEKVDLREALDAAASRARAIALWSLISVVIGFILNQIAERVPGGARLVTWLLGALWAIGTLFVIPMVAIERAPAVPALQNSLRMVRHRWAEGITGRVAIAAWTVVVTVPAVMVLVIGGAMVETSPVVGVAMMVGGVLVLLSTAALSASMNQVFAVALYRHAIDAPTGGFSKWDLENPFTGKPGKPQGKRRKSWILRIGGSFLALFLVVVVISAIVGSPQPNRAGDPYWHVRYFTNEARDVSAGTPIVHHGRRIGTVIRTTVEGREVDIAFTVNRRIHAGVLNRGFRARIARGPGGVTLRVAGIRR
jgi:hypothetical protein